MRISDWSSDVCSSDLEVSLFKHTNGDFLSCLICQLFQANSGRQARWTSADYHHVVGHRFPITHRILLAARPCSSGRRSSPTLDQILLCSIIDPLIDVGLIVNHEGRNGIQEERKSDV